MLNLLIGVTFKFGLGREAVRDDLFLYLPDIDATSIIGNLDNDMPAFVIGVQGNRPGFRLARLDTIFGPFEAVIAGIPDHVGQRILDHFENLTVQLRVCAEHLQFDLLTKIVTEIADNTRQFVPGVADRLHTGFHNPFLQVGRHVAEPLKRHFELTVFMMANHLQQLVARQHQFTDGRHQVFEKFDINADGLIGDGGFLRRRLLCLFRFCLFHGRLGFRLGRRLFRGCLFGFGTGDEFAFRSSEDHHRVVYRGGVDFQQRHRSCEMVPDLIEVRTAKAVLRELRKDRLKRVVEILIRTAENLDHVFDGVALHPDHVDTLEQRCQFLVGRYLAVHQLDRRIDCRRRAGTFVDGTFGRGGVGGRGVGSRGVGDRGCFFSRRRFGGFLGSGRCAPFLAGAVHRVELRDQFLVVAVRFGLRLFEHRDDFLDPVERSENQTYSLGSNLLDTIAEIAENVFTRMGNGFETRQADKAARTLDRVNESENIAEELRVVRILLQLDDFNVQIIQAFDCLCEEFCKKIVHKSPRP